MLSNRPRTLSISISVRLNLLTFWKFSRDLPVLIQSWKITVHQKQNDFFNKNGLVTRTSWTEENFLLKMPSTIKYEIAIFLKKSIFTWRRWFAVVWQQSLPCSKRDSLKNYRLERRINLTRTYCESWKKCSHAKCFCTSKKVKQLKQCSNSGGFVKSGILSQKKTWYAQLRWHITSISQHLFSAQLYRCENSCLRKIWWKSAMKPSWLYGLEDCQ